MKLASWTGKWQSQCQFGTGFFLVGAMFALPLSESAKAICLGFALFCIVNTKAFRRDLLFLITKSWCQAGILLCVLVLMSCFWSPATWHQKIEVVNKYSKCLLLPLLVLGFRDPKVRRSGIYAYLLAMFVICCLSILKALGKLDYNGDDPGQVVHNHIVTGLMMAFAAYLSALFAIRNTGVKRVVMSFLFLLFTTQIFFINTGRTGIFLDVMLMLLLMIQSFPWRLVLVGGLLGALLLLGVYHQSISFKKIVDESLANVRAYRVGDKNTSLGYRLQFHAFSKALFLRHPLLGNGAGSYTYYFRKEDPVPTWQSIPLASVPKKMVEPHSQYWFVAAELGTMGIVTLMFFFGGLLYAALQLQQMRAIAIALILPFMVGNLSESLLYYSITGTFFLLFMALCLGERYQAAADSTGV